MESVWLVLDGPLTFWMDSAWTARPGPLPFGMTSGAWRAAKAIPFTCPVAHLQFCIFVHAVQAYGGRRPGSACSLRWDDAHVPELRRSERQQFRTGGEFVHLCICPIAGQPGPPVAAAPRGGNTRAWTTQDRIDPPGNIATGKDPGTGMPCTKEARDIRASVAREIRGGGQGGR